MREGGSEIEKEGKNERKREGESSSSSNRKQENVGRLECFLPRERARERERILCPFLNCLA